jgi:putative RNA 2'-phosphotransferase
MNLNNLSKYMSLILRHKPEAACITLDEHGWANVDELINGIVKTDSKYIGLNIDIIEEIVRMDDKQRYSFNEDKTLIRANQGHSIPVDVELEKKEPPEFLYHGTGRKYVDSINKQGLIPKSRLYVHLSKDTETATDVGKRHGEVVLYMIKSKEMHQNQYEFYLSENGVWLTKEVPVEYMEEI